MDRNSFIKFSLAIGAGAILPGCNIFEDNLTKSILKRLIIVRLNGGNDGLYTLAPKNNKLLLLNRPQLYKPLQSGIEWENNWVLNPKLRQFADLYHQGLLQIIPNVGYPKFNTSHFKSSEIWETGFLPGESNILSGWIGRYLENKNISNVNHYLPICNLDESVWLFHKGRTKIGIDWTDNQPLAWFDGLKNQIPSMNPDDFGSDIISDINEYFIQLEKMRNVEPENGFSSSIFGNQIAKISDIINRNIPFQVLQAVQNGYDTHLGEQKRLNELYDDLSLNISKLVEKLKDNGALSQTLIFIYSEFGRTIDENKNGGTDHGAAGPVFLIGSGLDKLNSNSLKTFPELIVKAIGHNQYTQVQNDFRDIYKIIQNSWLA